MHSDATIGGASPRHAEPAGTPGAASAGVPSEGPLEVRAALERIRLHARVLGRERVALPHALDRHLAVPVVAASPHPPADNAAMDGYAVRAADTAGAGAESTVVLRVVGEQPAGRPARRRVGPGEAVAIGTGAVLPPGADAVVVKEAVERVGRRPAAGDGAGAGIRIRTPVAAGDHVRRAGEEYRAGERILPAGVRLTPPAIGLLATAGVSIVPVVARPRVALLTTGDELVPGWRQEVPAHAIRDSNGPLLEALCRRAGAVVTAREHLGDDPGAIAAWLERQARVADLLVTTGGASVGDHDVLARAWARAGVATEFWGVAMKPGRPVRFGIRPQPGGDARPRLVFALSGNPLAALTQFDLFLAPLLAFMAGGAWDDRPRVRLPLAAEPASGRAQVPVYRRARREGPVGRAALRADRSGSGMLRGAAASPFLVELPPRGTERLAGAPAEAIAEPEALRGATWRPAAPLPLLLGIRGRPGIGKTALIEALLPALAARGIRTGTIRQAQAGVALDVACRDSQRHASAGAACVLLLAPGQAGFFVPRDAEPEAGSWLELFAGRVDLVLVEGVSPQPIPSLTIVDGPGPAPAFAAEGDGWRLRWTAGSAPAPPVGGGLPRPVLDRVADAIAARLGGAGARPAGGRDGG
jgi:molybdopterin molybdotransferase